MSGVENYKIEGNRLRVGTSLDQLMAKKIGNETPLPSLCLGIKPDSKIQTDYSSVYRSYISWKSPSQPAGKEIDPRFAFDLLFADKEKQQRNKSILDAVHDQAKDLQRHVSRPDREKLDEFLTSVREVEDRIDQADRAGAERWTPAEGVPQPARPERMPEDRQEHVRLMLDLIVLAFQMNQTRIATFMFENGGCSGNFSFLPGVTEQWHATSHHQEKPEIMMQYEAINRWHVEQLAYFLERMDSIHEGEGTLLDHSMIVMGSRPQGRQQAHLSRPASDFCRWRKRDDSHWTHNRLSAGTRRWRGFISRSPSAWERRSRAWPTSRGRLEDLRRFRCSTRPRRSRGSGRKG